MSSAKFEKIQTFQDPWNASSDSFYAGCTINNVFLNNFRKVYLEIVRNIHLVTYNDWKKRVRKGKGKRVAFSKTTATEYWLTFSHTSFQTIKASWKKTRGTDSDIYHYRKTCSQLLPCETQHDCELREAFQMLETTNNRKSFHKADILKLWR